MLTSSVLTYSPRSHIANDMLGDNAGLYVKPRSASMLKQQVTGKRISYAKPDITSDDYIEEMVSNVVEHVLPFNRNKNHRSNMRYSSQSNNSSATSDGNFLYPKQPLTLNPFTFYLASNENDKNLKPSRPLTSIEVPIHLTDPSCKEKLGLEEYDLGRHERLLVDSSVKGHVVGWDNLNQSDPDPQRLLTSSVTLDCVTKKLPSVSSYLVKGEECVQPNYNAPTDELILQANNAKRLDPFKEVNPQKQIKLKSKLGTQGVYGVLEDTKYEPTEVEFDKLHNNTLVQWKPKPIKHVNTRPGFNDYLELEKNYKTEKPHLLFEPEECIEQRKFAAFYAGKPVNFSES